MKAENVALMLPFCGRASREVNMNRRQVVESGVTMLGIGFFGPWTSAEARAQGREDTLVIVTEYGPNSLDIQGLGANQPTHGPSWNIYDRLLTYDTKTLPDGTSSYDYTKVRPELAESWNTAADGMSVTFKLRSDAIFHDGTPVTANDVKWSLDRAVGIGGFSTIQMAAGSLQKPEQFEVLDDKTLRISFLRSHSRTSQ
jgi:peptide/nickel transport system substrate-binding protein